MYNYFVPTMSLILSQIKDLLVDSQTNNIIQNVHINNNQSYTLWNWKDYYQSQSLDGLQNCSFFQQEIAVFDSNGNLTNVVNFTKWQKWNEYRVKASQNLNNTCN